MYKIFVFIKYTGLVYYFVFLLLIRIEKYILLVRNIKSILVIEIIIIYIFVIFKI